MEGYLKNKENIDLYYVKKAPVNPKGIVVIVHGFAEHLGRYEYVSDKLNQEGYVVYRFDNRGHGKSGGDRGHINSFMDFVYDADEIVNMGKEEYPNLPIFMLGHSMGGFITFCYGIKFPDKLDGQILSGAAIRKVPQVEGIKGNICKLLDIFAPKIRVKNELSKDICSVEKVVADYENDPLVLKNATLNFYVQFLLRGTEWIDKNIEKYQYPCLVIHGEKDKIVPVETGKYLYDHISSKDKEIKIYKGLYHEIMNENEKDIVIKDITNWVEKRLNLLNNCHNQRN